MSCPRRAHADPLPCRVAKGLDCAFPIWFTQCDRVWFTHTMSCSCRAPTTPFWKRLLKAQHGRGAARYVWINIGLRQTACGRPTQTRLLPATTRSSMTVVIRNSNWNAAGQCETKQRLSWARRSWLFWCENTSVIQFTAQRLRKQFSEQDYMKTLPCHFFHVCTVMFIKKQINMLLMLKELPLTCSTTCLALTQ